MTSRERVLTALSHRPPDRTPFYWGFGPQPPALAALNEWLQPFGLDFAELRRLTDDLIRVDPRYVGPSLPANQSPWGWTVKPMSYGAGYYEEFDYQPLATVETEAELCRYPWPRVDWFELPEFEPGTKARVIWGGNPLETLMWMTGLERTLAMLVESPNWVRTALAFITDFYDELLRRCLRDAEFDAVFFADDLGSQTGPLISPTLYQEVVQPFHQRLFTTAHERVRYVMFHSDGSVFALLPALIAAGLDCLEAVQVECANMEPERLKTTFGDRLSFQGAVSVQQVLPRGTPETVRATVAKLVRVLGAGGGYICGPSHAIQAGTPPANAIAMMEEVTGFRL